MYYSLLLISVLIFYIKERLQLTYSLARIHNNAAYGMLHMTIYIKLRIHIVFIIYLVYALYFFLFGVVAFPVFTMLPRKGYSYVHVTDILRCNIINALKIRQ